MFTATFVYFECTVLSWVYVLFFICTYVLYSNFLSKVQYDCSTVISWLRHNVTVLLSHKIQAHDLGMNPPSTCRLHGWSVCCLTSPLVGGRGEGGTNTSMLLPGHCLSYGLISPSHCQESGSFITWEGRTITAGSSRTCSPTPGSTSGSAAAEELMLMWALNLIK